MVKADHLKAADRSMPHNLDAEKKVLGAMIRDQEALHLASGILGQNAFYQPNHQKIFDTLVELGSKGLAIDLLTLSDALERKKELVTVGGSYFLADLVQCVATSANVEHHAGIIREKSLRRKLIRECSLAIQDAHDSPDDAPEILSRTESRIFNISQQRTDRSFEPVGKFLDAAIAKVEQAHQNQGMVTGIPTGFTDLDNMTLGLQRSDLIILAARPSVGKTSLVMNIAENVAMANIPVGIFSLEMSSEQIAERVLCSQAQINLKHLRSGFFTKREAAKFLKTASAIHNIPLYIDDTPNLTPTEVFSRSRRLKSHQPELGLIVIDYLQLMSTGGKSDNRQQEVSEISRSMKILARDLNIPLICCSQLSRAVEKRDDQTPKLSDLRESGAIEQDADIVIFLHREPRTDGSREEMEAGHEVHHSHKLIIGKHRNGPIGEMDIYFAKEYTRFFDAAKDDDHSGGDDPPF